MGFRDNAIKAGSLDVGKKSKGKMKKDGDEKEIGCCVKFTCFGKCIPSRSKVDSSKSGTTSAYSGNFLSFYDVIFLLFLEMILVLHYC